MAVVLVGETNKLWLQSEGAQVSQSFRAAIAESTHGFLCLHRFFSHLCMRSSNESGCVFVSSSLSSLVSLFWCLRNFNDRVLLIGDTQRGPSLCPYPLQSGFLSCHFWTFCSGAEGVLMIVCLIIGWSVNQLFGDHKRLEPMPIWSCFYKLQGVLYCQNGDLLMLCGW